jgi:hypothetical protein
MQLIGEVSIPNPESEMQYLIDRKELLRLKEMKLIQTTFYVYLAARVAGEIISPAIPHLKLTYSHREPSVDIPSFAEQWELTEPELAIALAQLQKKGALQPVARQLKLELF